MWFNIRMASNLTLGQGMAGYRYNRDSFLLADFFRPRGAKRLLDIGAGAGAVSILIKADNPETSLVAVEIDPDSARMAKSNAMLSGLCGYHVAVADILDAPFGRGLKLFDAVVSNPPYRKAGHGRLCADPVRAAARHELRMTLDDLARISSKLLREGGTLTISMIPDRADEYGRILENHGFSETRRRDVIPVPGGPASIFLSEARLGAPCEKIVEPPLFLRAPEGGDSEEYRRIAARHA